MADSTHPHRSEGEPHDRMTRIANHTLAKFETTPEYQEGDRAIVFVNGGGRGGIGVSDAYEGRDLEVIADIFQHLKAIMEANGKHLEIHSVDQMGQG